MTSLVSLVSVRKMSDAGSDDLDEERVQDLGVRIFSINTECILKCFINVFFYVFLFDIISVCIMFNGYFCQCHAATAATLQ